MPKLEGKAVVITGAARGIGRAIAERFGAEGAKLLLITRNSPLDPVINDLKSRGVDVEGMAGDVADTTFAKEAVDRCLERFGAVDVLVNNAGVTRDGLLARMKEDDFDEVVRTNLKGAFVMMQAVGKVMMKARKGAIVNISSVVGLTGNAGQINYAATKAGVIGMTKSAAKELGGRNVRVNAVAPGFIVTDMTHELPEKVKESVIGVTPLGRFGEAAEVAAATLFLASDEASYVTGHTLTVDGGMAMY
jgi:3-oxoacyl-[acyl-carrier protein] reductase